MKYEATIILGVIAAGAWLLYKAGSAAGAAVGNAVTAVTEAAGNAADATSSYLEKNFNDDSSVAMLQDHFNADHWRPAGYYTDGGTLILGTGGMELKPEFRVENGGPGY